MARYVTLALWVSSAAAQLMTVDTTSGTVTGHGAPYASNLFEYLDIPLAKAPVGKLRFAKPQRFNSTEPYEASTFGYDCSLTPSAPVDYPELAHQAQRIIANFASATGNPQSEDCLTLNIWARVTRKSHLALKPVLVFFYGGREHLTAPDYLYPGDLMIETEDIVVVTVNYRINICGFPGAPGEPQNLGLRDQRTAVEWIRDNIVGCRGDATKVTLIGQSSGGVAVYYWSYAYVEDPIASGLVMHSGNALSFPVNPPSVPEKNWNAVAAAVGFINNSADHGGVMVCMRNVSWEDIKAAVAQVRPTRSSSPLRSIPAFYPMPDNELVFEDYRNRTAFSPLPVLMGYNANEAGYYRIPAFANGIEPTDAEVNAFHLESFICPTLAQAEMRRSHGVPAWVYRYEADWDSTRLYPSSGTYHGVDMHMIFGNSEDVSGLSASKPQEKLMRVMQWTWVAFCDNPGSGLTRLGWPVFDRGGETLQIFGKDNGPTGQPAHFNAVCSTGSFHTSGPMKIASVRAPR